MEELKIEELDRVNGGSLAVDISWGAAGGAMGALGAMEISAVRNAIGWK